MPLNQEQEAAVNAMVAHCNSTSGSPFFVLKGPAGTGKTFSARTFVDRFKRRTVFTAPTNKAVRVLRETLRTDDYRPECKTIYSLLGLQMTASGEIKVLTKPEDDVDIGEYAVVFVDEASMLSRPMLKVYIAEAAARHPKIRWIFMGDPYQLPPVGEVSSEVWGYAGGAELTKVMRQDNQILKLSLHLRERVDKPFGKLLLASDNDGTEGIWTCTAAQLDQLIKDKSQTFLKGESKAIAWRNVEVDRLNIMVRKELFADATKYFWQPGDRVTLLEPAKDQLDDEHRIIGITDEEGAVERADLTDHPAHPGFECWRVQMRSDFNTPLTLWVPTPAGARNVESRAARLAAEARSSRNWREFWGFKESFHKVRHAYAITAHRAQGSTYTNAFVSWRDILLNRSRGEAMRCLYVACSRPRKELYLG